MTWAPFLLLLNVAEVHQFPHARVADVLDDLAVAEMLEPNLSREAQVRAVEMRELRDEVLDSLQAFDELTVNDGLSPIETDPVAVATGAVFVHHGVRDRFSAGVVHVHVRDA
jgi:hypothetical protein